MISIGPKIPMKNSVFISPNYKPLLGEIALGLGFFPKENSPCVNSECGAPLGANPAGTITLDNKEYLISVCRECESVFGNQISRD